MSIVIGIDFGSVRCGVARADVEARVAVPVAVVPTSDLVECLQKIDAAEEIATIVFGRSQNFKREDNPIMESAQVCADEVEKMMRVPVVWHDELFTSVEAATHLNTFNADRGRKPATRFELDASAATIILQSYLDSNQKHIND